MTINASKGAVFDTLAALLLSLVVPIPERPQGQGVEFEERLALWSGLFACSAGVDQEVKWCGVEGSAHVSWGVTVHCFTV